MQPAGQLESSAAGYVDHAATTPFAAGVGQAFAAVAAGPAAGPAAAAAAAAAEPAAAAVVAVGIEMSAVTAGQVVPEAVHSGGLWLAEVSIAELAANPAASAVAGVAAAVQLGSVVELTEDAVAAELGSARSDSALSMLAASGLGGRVVQAVRPVLDCFAVSSRAASPDDVAVLELELVAAVPVLVLVAAELAVAVVAAAADVGLAAAAAAAAAASWLDVDFAGLVAAAVAPAIVVEQGGLAAAQGSSAAAGCFGRLAGFVVAASSTIATVVGSFAAFADEEFPLPVPAGSSSGALCVVVAAAEAEPSWPDCRWPVEAAAAA